MTAYKRAQVLLRTDADDPEDVVRFAGPVKTGVTYRGDDVFVCSRGHRRLEPACSCGFYGLEREADVRPSVVTTALLEVAFEGRVVRHRECVRAERQRVRSVVFDGWCSFCVQPASFVAGIVSAWSDVPAPWLRASPVCDGHTRLYGLVRDLDAVAEAVGAAVRFDRSGESRAARSLRRQYSAKLFVR